MPAIAPGSEDGILNTYAEGILGKYTAEFAGACSAFHSTCTQHCNDVTRQYALSLAAHMQEAVPYRYKVLCALNLGCSCAADGSSAEDDRELADALQRVREQLHGTQSSAAVCLICLETMHSDDAVWHCSRGCCCVLHLLCIQAWSRQQVVAAAYSASQESARYSNDHDWHELLNCCAKECKRQECMHGLAAGVECCVRTQFYFV